MNESNPFFSVIMPVFNEEEYLNEAVESVRAQTFQDWELLLIDDGSTDNSPKLIAELCQKDSRIRALRQRNRRTAAARNRGFAMAKATWICYLDGDDVWLPQTLESYHDYLLAHPSAMFIYGYRHRLCDGKITYAQPYQQTAPTGSRELFQSTFLSTISVCHHRELVDKVGGYDETLLLGEDYELFLRMSRIVTFEPLGIATALRRRHSHNLSHQTGFSLLLQTGILLRFAEEFVAKGLISSQMMKKRIGHSFYAAGREYCRQRCFGQALAAFRASGHYSLPWKGYGLKLLAWLLQPFSRQDNRPYPLPLRTPTWNLNITREGDSLYPSVGRSVEGEYNGDTTCANTKHKQAEEALRKSEERFAKAFNASNITMAITEYDTGRFVDVNEAFCAALGYTKAEVLGKTAAELGIFADASTRQAYVTLVQKHGFAKNVEVEVFTRSREHRWGIFTADCISLDKDRYLLTTMLDITERKQAEAERARLEQQLQQTQKLESLGVLAGGIAHDFNNLLSGIFGYLDMAKELCKNEQANVYLTKALSVIERTRGLTQQLLTFAKGGAPIRKVDQLFPFVQDTAQFACSGANVSCSYDIQQSLWPCNFDRAQIGQVIDNVIINAQQAMPMGGVIQISAVNITLEKNEVAMLAKGDYVKISIKDSGIGVPADILPRIFDPFFTTKQKGSGLGLATAYSIIKRHDGCILVESEQGKGSTFHIYLPALRDTVTDVPQDNISEHKRTGRILVMDDEPLIRDVTASMLKVLGYSTVATKDGEEALAILKEETAANRFFTAIILDLTVPGGMGGKETAAAVRKTNTDIPIFVSSGYAEDPVMADPGKYGFTDCIRKPFRKSELMAVLDKHLKEPSPQSPESK